MTYDEKIIKLFEDHPKKAFSSTIICRMLIIEYNIPLHLRQNLPSNINIRLNKLIEDKVLLRNKGVTNRQGHTYELSNYHEIDKTTKKIEELKAELKKLKAKLILLNK